MIRAKPHKRAPGRRRKARKICAVGLLGGSFHPAHSGHLYISRYAKKRLGLKQVWWLPAVRHPLKESCGGYDERRASALRLLSQESMAYRLCEADKRRDYRYSWQTLTYLRRRYRGMRFIWLMGADCWIDLPRWRRWRALFRSVPFAVFSRAPYGLRSVRSVSGIVLRYYRLSLRRSLVLKFCDSGWVYFSPAGCDVSSTVLRDGG